MNGLEEHAILTAGPWRAVVLPGFGMNMISLQYQGRAILREPKDMETLSRQPFLYGTPLLFPANRTAGGRFTFEGREYHLPVNEPVWGNHLHGLMYAAPFQVLEKTERTVTCIFENTGVRYPFPFRMTIADSLDEQGWRRILALTNTGKGNMPYTLAFHTAFVAPQMFSVQLGKRYARSDTFVPTGVMEALTEEEKTYLTGACPAGKALSGYYTAAGNQAVLDDMVMTASENFDQRVLYNGGGDQDFLCIEPQCGQVNGLNTPHGHCVLGPGQTEVFTLSIGKETNA